MGQFLEPIRVRLADLSTQAAALRRDIAAAALDRAAGDTKAGDRIAQLSDDLRRNEDQQAAERMALGHAETFDKEHATRARHQAAHKALAELDALMQRRRKLAADLDKAVAAVAKGLTALREACTQSRELAGVACTNAMSALPMHQRIDRQAPVLDGVDLKDGAFLAAAATMLAQVFRLDDAQGQHFFNLVLEAQRMGAGHHTNGDRCLTFTDAADQIAERLPFALVPLRNALAAEAAELGPEPKHEGLLA